MEKIKIKVLLLIGLSVLMGLFWMVLGGQDFMVIDLGFIKISPEGVVILNSILLALSFTGFTLCLKSSLSYYFELLGDFLLKAVVVITAVYLIALGVIGFFWLEVEYAQVVNFVRGMTVLILIGFLVFVFVRKREH
jgi:apolipoprotein N-acyltransferase